MGRGAAGAAGKAASEARRLPWRLACDESAGRRMLLVAVSLREPRQSVAAYGRSLARTDIRTLFTLMTPPGIRRNPASGVLSAELRFARANPSGSPRLTARPTKKHRRLPVFFVGDPTGTRTRVTAVKGRCLNRLTMGPYVCKPQNAVVFG